MIYGSKFNVAKGNLLPLFQALASMFILSSISICSAEDSLNLIIHEGEDFSFDCCENPERLIKSFIVEIPNGGIYYAVKGHPFVNEKATATISETCEVNIKEAEMKDNGVWKCDVFVHDENTKSISVTERYVNVTLLEPREQESNRTLTIHKGKDFSFDCCESPNGVIKSLIVHNPNGDIHYAVEGHPFVNEKVTATISEACEVDIKEAGVKDNGLWKCDVFFHDENSKSASVYHRYINVNLSEPQDQESNRTLAIVLSIFGVGLFIVLVACYVCIPCNGQNNNGLNNNSQEDTAPDTGNALNNTSREGNSHEDTATATGNNQGNIGTGIHSPAVAIPITENAQDNRRTGSNSQEGSSQSINAHDKNSLEMDSLENTPPKINIIPKTPKKNTLPPYGRGGHNGWSPENTHNGF